MLRSIWEDIKREFSYGNMVTRIIIVNIGVFVFIHLVNIIVYISKGGNAWGEGFYDFVHWFSMSSDGLHILTHPWVLISAMFLHVDFFHILFNLLVMYWFGRVVGDLYGNQRVLPIYLLGGLFGSVLFFITANLLPYGEEGPFFAYGASAGVMAIVTASGAIAPNYIFRLILIGDVKLKYLVMAIIFLFMVQIAFQSQEGSHFAHLGGAFMGYLFVRQTQQGNDWSIPINRILDTITGFFNGRKLNARRGPKVAYRNPEADSQPRRSKRTSRRGNNDSDDGNAFSDQERIDAILDKIKESGYESLNDEEKEFLFNASKK